uniref:Uncharacterized protein n=1 Tax=Anguilla anguilla TaxID=7936 RepID=A0A0E9QE04_ANGAN
MTAKCSHLMQVNSALPISSDD